MKFFESLKRRARALKAEVHALWLASRDPQTPAAAKWLVLFIVVYAVSPIDLIPDFIPVIGYLDDLILLPLGIALALRMIPAEVMERCRDRAETEPFHIPKKWKSTAMIGVIFVWIVCLAVTCWILFRRHPTTPFQ